MTDYFYGSPKTSFVKVLQSDESYITYEEGENDTLLVCD